LLLESRGLAISGPKKSLTHLAIFQNVFDTSGTSLQGCGAQIDEIFHILLQPEARTQRLSIVSFQITKPIMLGSSANCATRLCLSSVLDLDQACC
jgi:hypothetical protein